MRFAVAAGTLAPEGGRTTDAFVVSDLASLNMSGPAAERAELTCPALLLGVFDGNGIGDAGGAAAARVAASLRAHLAARPGAALDAAALDAAVRAADADLLDAAAGQPALRGSGSTATVLAIGAGGLAIAHVGDSRAYRLRDGRLERLTEDHTLLAELLASGALSAAEAPTFPHRSVLTRVVGMGAGLQVASSSHDVRPGDVLVLCTDGVTETAEPAIEQALRAHAAPADSCRALLAAALADGTDCATAVVARVDQVDAAGAGGLRA